MLGVRPTGAEEIAPVGDLPAGACVAADSAFGPGAKPGSPPAAAPLWVVDEGTAGAEIPVAGDAAVSLCGGGDSDSATAFCLSAFPDSRFAGASSPLALLSEPCPSAGLRSAIPCVAALGGRPTAVDAGTPRAAPPTGSRQFLRIQSEQP